MQASRKRQGSLDSLLAGSRVRDTLTLWHLLARVDGDDRERVYDRMVELAPPPEGVTRAGALALNQQMLDSWKEKLESSWGDYSSPAMSRCRLSTAGCQPARWSEYTGWQPVLQQAEVRFVGHGKKL